jgi:hypothetical protein
MLCHIISPFTNPSREKSGNMTSCIDASLKTFMINRIEKTHKTKGVQHDV